MHFQMNGLTQNNKLLIKQKQRVLQQNHPDTTAFWYARAHRLEGFEWRKEGTNGQKEINKASMRDWNQLRERE